MSHENSFSLSSHFMSSLKSSKNDLLESTTLLDFSDWAKTLKNSESQLNAKMISNSHALFSSKQAKALNIIMSDIIEKAIQTVFKNIQSTIQVIIDNIQQQVFMKVSLQHYIQIITQWKSSEIEFFYSDMLISWKQYDIMNKENKIYYQSIIIFIS